jgi:hypothetical protein
MTPDGTPPKKQNAAQPTEWGLFGVFMPASIAAGEHPPAVAQRHHEEAEPPRGPVDPDCPGVRPVRLFHLLGNVIFRNGS